MGTGQMMLTIGAIMILSLNVLTVNRNIIRSNEQMMDAETTLAANAAARGVIEEIRSKSFDQNSDIGLTKTVNSMTSVNELGYESGETLTTFNDVDDYNNLQKIVYSDRVGSFQTFTKVEYVDPDQPDVVRKTRTEAKRVTVKVYSPYIKDTLSIPYIRGIWR